MKASRGYTLIEMMVTVSIAGVILSLAIPSYNNLVNDEYIAGASNQLLGAMRLARSEAVKRKTQVKVCAGNGGRQCADVNNSWVNGWIVYVDTNNNDAIDDVDTVIKVMRPAGNSLTITPDANLYNLNVTFFSKGQVSASGNFAFCDDRGSGFSRNLRLSLSGRAKVGVEGGATCS
ncbi:MAG: hypothetical protein COB04_02885 [Gammaproteobacteria bacterium]|nr:MAG: hypothetical protein COB04_02885 [Gammaproteobacteria bacterium]